MDSLLHGAGHKGSDWWKDGYFKVPCLELALKPSREIGIRSHNNDIDIDIGSKKLLQRFLLASSPITHLSKVLESLLGPN